MVYFNLPVLFNYETIKGFYGEAGLQPGFLISARDKIDGGETFETKECDNGFELAIPLGAGYQINDQINLVTRAIFGATN